MCSDVSGLKKASSEVTGRQLAELLERELAARKSLSKTGDHEPGGGRL
jgi:hypothetical protein